MRDTTPEATIAIGSGAANPDQFGRSYTNYAVIILMLVYAMNIVDRLILNVLLQPIKLELGISDTQIGFLTGFSFAIFYATLGIPIAMWADRGNRRNIIALALMTFSVATFVCGFVTSFLQLLITRFFVAIGEAGTAPSSHSMISDLVPPQKRGTALGLYSLGGNIGILIGLPIAGWVSQWYGWRAAFFIIGLPGLVIALLVRFTLREPIRGSAEASVGQSAVATPPMSEVLRYLWSQRSFRHLAAGVVIMTISTYSMSVWVPAFLMRSFHISAGEVSTLFALIFGLSGGAGTFLGGYIGDSLGKRDVRWNVWIMAISQAASFPFCVAMYLATAKAISVSLFIIPAFVFTFYMAPVISMTQALVPVRMRSRASAILLFLVALIGGSLGPQLAGALSDFLEPIYGTESLRYALLVMLIFWLWSIIHFVFAAGKLKDDIARARTF